MFVLAAIPSGIFQSVLGTCGVSTPGQEEEMALGAKEEDEEAWTVRRRKLLEKVEMLGGEEEPGIEEGG
jgi:hypothetical protein